jgi:cell division protein FtsL
MDVFKYIAEILKQFTHAQKILALLMLLLAIIMLSLGPKMIDSMTKDTTELNAHISQQDNIIKLQNKRIHNLELTTDSLDTKIRNGERNCTDEIVKRENEFVAMLDELKGDMKRQPAIRTVKYHADYQPMPIPVESEGVAKDEMIVNMKMAEPVIVQPNFNKFIDKIDKMKSKIKQ